MTEKKTYPPWDDKPNPELPKQEWGVYGWAEGSGKSEIKPRLYEIGTVQGCDYAEAHGVADQRYGSQMYDYISPVNPAGEPMRPPPKKPDPGLKD